MSSEQFPLATIKDNRFLFMSLKQRMGLLALAALILLASTAFSSSAFTSTTLERDADLTVVTDAAAYVALIDGHPNGGLVEQTGDGMLTIDFTRGGAHGANARALFELGASQAPVNDHAFKIVNQGTQTRDFQFRYTLDSSAADGSSTTQNLRFTFYHDTGSDGTVDTTYSLSEHPGSNHVIITDVASGDTIYAVVTVDTRGLSAASDLSGTLDVRAGAAG